METIEQQEWRSRQKLDLAAVFKAAFGCGMIFFVMSGGSPFSTSGTMNMVMGRELQIPFLGLLVGHFAMSLLYTFIIAVCIYRFPASVGVPLGVAVGIGLYLVNTVIFQTIGFEMPNKEFVTFFVHVVFSLFASLLYKAFSIPKVQDTGAAVAGR
jgi:hypothetical protein